MIFLRYYPVRFQRQKAIGNYIADFYCAKARLVIELDGGGHYTAELARVYLKTPNAPGQRTFSRCAAPFFLEIRQYSCEKMSCSAQKFLAAGHIGSFQIHPRTHKVLLSIQYSLQSEVPVLPLCYLFFTIFAVLCAIRKYRSLLCKAYRGARENHKISVLLHNHA